ncbi:SDR family NAD(P)-dependent oxidoreductase [Burkholderia gladioli]|uniref:SDR family NAD(P)-dependent oxidoreductase n=1 Tax=Burkholderia gladioli TaxID=28095 RepID=UPI0003A9F548|nr:SDR family NAD(P)-dependent oxidoreductase [Burkholderia gladioli]NHH79087.1 putative oxidoreductase [Burkholderia gladioli]CAG9216699.1 hypothetical protein BGLA2_260071 [Burkholderia gladioli]
MNGTKVIAITGASSGIGRATARLLAKQGHAVVLGARREVELASLAAEIDHAGGRACHLVTGVTRRADLEALVAHAVTHFGRLDVMVNNAGIGPISRFDALRVDDWDAMIDVNLRGTLYGIAAALPVFARSVGMSPSSFHKHFKAVTASSPLQYRKGLQLMEARRLLRAGMLSVSMAAFDVGYESAAQFSRDYMRKFGISPKHDIPEE